MSDRTAGDALSRLYATAPALAQANAAPALRKQRGAGVARAARARDANRTVPAKRNAFAKKLLRRDEDALAVDRVIEVRQREHGGELRQRLEVDRSAQQRFARDLLGRW